MNRWAWIMRAVVVVVAGALLVSATAVAVSPRLWRIANAHAEVPIELPDFSAVSQRSEAFDGAGKPIATYELENSQPILIDDLPADVTNAFLAVEDSEFFVHHGVNVRGLFRATLSNFAADGPTQGASTITMQVVKNDYLAGLERNGRYKLVQAAYAVRLEKQKTKRQILERYLNTVFFGQNSYGIAAAAETYFGKAASDLTLVEAGFLAGLVQAPTNYDPITQPERSRTRFNQVLNRLVALGLISEAQREETDATFVLPERVRRTAERSEARTHFSEAVRDYLLNRTDILGDTYEERYTRLNRGGLRIYTTIDPQTQALAEAARNVLPANEAGIDSAMTTIENKTGAVRAMVGGAPFVPGKNEVNLALAPSQTGSSIKLFVLAAAIQAGGEADDLIDGTRGCTLPNPGDPSKPFQLKSGLGRDGVNTLRVQTANSVNCAFARLSQIVGLNRTVDTTYRMAESPYLYRGQEDRKPLDNYASFAIGANEMSTLDMASGMQTIANQGIHMEPYLVERIEDSAGNRVYTHQDEGVRVLERNAALTTIDILRGPPSVGTARNALSEMSKRRPVIGKTGTQDSNTTAWFVGSTPQFTTAVLVRDPDRYTEMRGIPEFKGVSKVQGGTYPALIWRELMDKTGLEVATQDWPLPPEPARPAARLYLPGNECVLQFSGYKNQSYSQPVEEPAGFARGAVTQNASNIPAVAEIHTNSAGTLGPSPEPNPNPAPTPTNPPDNTPAPPPPPDQTYGPAPESTSTDAPQTTTVTRKKPVYRSVEVGTTVPSDVLDPNAPMPSVPIKSPVGKCR